MFLHRVVVCVFTAGTKYTLGVSHWTLMTGHDQEREND